MAVVVKSASGGHPAGRVDLERVAGAEVDVDDRGGVDVGQHRVDAADVRLERVAQLPEDADVDVAGRADRADQRHVLALEHGGVAGDAALDRLLEHDVRLVQPRLRPAGGVVVDLDRDGGALGDRATRGRLPGERAGRRRHRRRGRGRRLGLERGGVVRGGGAGAQHESREPDGGQRAPGERSARPGAVYVGCAHFCGSIVGGRRAEVVAGAVAGALRRSAAVRPRGCSTADPALAAAPR